MRYLDTQPGRDWIVPVAIVAALFGDHATTEAALEIAAPVAGRWVPAYRNGLRDPALRRAAAALVELAAGRLAGTGLPAGRPGPRHRDRPAAGCTDRGAVMT